MGNIGTNLLKVKLNSNKFDKKRADKIATACFLLERIVNTIEFKVFCMQHNIWNKVYSGLQPTENKPDYEIDVNPILYKTRNKVIGYTYLNSPFVWINQKFFDKFNYVQIASNLAHEIIGHQILQIDHSKSLNMWKDLAYLLGNEITRIANAKGWKQ